MVAPHLTSPQSADGHVRRASRGKSGRLRTVAALTAAVFAGSALVGCSPFGSDATNLRELDQEVASWNLTTVGDVVVECSRPAALGAQYHYTLVLRGDGAWEAVQEKLADAGFAPTLAQDNAARRTDLERQDPGRTWSTAVSLVPSPPSGTVCDGSITAETGDTVVELSTTMKESR